MHIVYRSGLIVACIYAGIFLVSRPGYSAAESLLVALFTIQLLGFGQPRAIALLKNDRLFQAWCVFLVLTIVTWVVVTVAQPAGVTPTTNDTRDYLRAVMIIVLSFYIAALSEKASWLIPVTALAGALLFVILHADWTLWEHLIAGKRIDMGLRNAQHTGLIFGTFFLGTLIFSFRAAQLTSSWRRLAVAVLVLALIGGFGWLVVGTQTRGIWLGLVPGILIACFMAFKQAPHQGFPGRYGWPLIGVALILGLALSVGAHDIVANRLSAEELTLKKLDSTLDLEKLPETRLSSIYIRIVSWATAMEWIAERPLLGWGPDAVPTLFDQATHLSDRFGPGGFGHLHNSYMEVLVAYGVPGLLLYLAFYVLLAAAALRHYRSGALPADVFIFFWSFLGFWTVSNLFESYIKYDSGQYIAAVVFGFVYSFCLRPGFKEVSVEK